MSTIYDVAKAAGVAPITVSRVINNSGYVSPETRVRVEKSIADLDYVPNRLAQGLRSKQTHTLGMVVTDITNPFWTTVVRGVEDAAHAANFNVILCNTDESIEKQDKYVRVLLQKQVDGFVIVPARSSDETVILIQDAEVPLVVMDRKVGVPVDSVRCDSEGGAYQLIQYLIGLGHQHIAVLSGSPNVSTAVDRVQGYRRAVQDAGLALDEELILEREFTQAAGYDMVRHMMSLSPRPSAVFAVNNFIAIGAYKALREMNLRVPEDISMVAFDDLPPTLVMEPFLTVAAQPAYEMGYQATGLLLDRISGKLPDQVQSIVLPTELIVRTSTRTV
ncbi:MAG: LacI family DNA-binding transcriptional regulator [Anaerolineae bacterium]|nr:LacI family DNA-binding transcriptional regulator [Anaerolineae bacterium]